MKIFIIGAGQIGSNLAIKLSKEKHDVTIFDREEDPIKEVSKAIDANAICQPMSPKNLASQGIAQADMMIAVTDVDEINLIACQIAKKYGVQYTIARVNNIDYDKRHSILRPRDFGADIIINQMSSTTKEIVQLVDTPGATDIATFSDDQIELVGFHINQDSLLANRGLNSLRELPAFREHLIVAINRDGNTIIPSGQNRILPNDKIYVIGRTDSISKILPLVGNLKKTALRVMIYGGNRLGVNLAQAFERMGKKVVLIEPSKERCLALQAHLQKTLIMHGSGSDSNLLRMEGIAHTDVYIAITDNEDANLLASLTAKENGAKRTLCLIHRPEYFQLINSLGVDVVISPKITTEGIILKYIRRGRVYNVATIKGTETEVMEIGAEANSPITKDLIKNLYLPKGIILGAIVREQLLIIPSGNDQVMANDRVIVFHLEMDTESISVWFSELKE